MTGQLVYRKEFEKALQDYHVSESGKQILASTKLALFVGPSASGRNTIIDELLKTGDFHQIVSDTTRQPRMNNGVLEQNGREYWFRTEAEMLADLQTGKYLEAAIIHQQQVSGISLRELEQTSRQHKVAVNEIEVVGMQNIIDLKPDTYAFFVLPPSMEVWLRRLQSRGAMPADEQRRRFMSAVGELTAALTKNYYTFIVNDAFEHSVERVQKLVLGEEHDPEHQQHGRDVAERLLVQIDEYLN